MFWKISKLVLDEIYPYVFDNLIHLHDVASNCVSLLLPWTCYVFDFISVSLYFGSDFWICVVFWTYDFSRNSLFHEYSYTKCFELRVLTASINELCFWFHECFLILLITDLDLYVFVVFPMFHKYMCRTNCLMKTWVPASTMIVLCVWYHRRFLWLWLTNLDLFVFVESICLS